MGNLERLLGRLEEFQKSAEKRFDSLEAKVDALNQFKWRVAGGAALLSVFLTATIEFFRK